MRLSPQRHDRGERLLAAFYALASVGIVAGITHLALILLGPVRAGDDAYTRVALLAKGAPLKTISAAVGGHPIVPGEDPALATAYCLYDLASGPVSVSLDVTGSSYAAVSLHSRRGIAYYGLTNRSASDDHKIALVLTRHQGAAADDPDADTKLQIEAPDDRGFVMVQALADTLSARPTAEAVVSRLSCTTSNP